MGLERVQWGLVKVLWEWQLEVEQELRVQYIEWEVQEVFQGLQKEYYLKMIVVR